MDIFPVRTVTLRPRLLTVAVFILVAFIAGFAFPAGSSPAFASEAEQSQASSETEEPANQGSTETVTADEEEKEKEKEPEPEPGDGGQEVVDPAPQDPALEETEPTPQTQETELPVGDPQGGTADTGDAALPDKQTDVSTKPGTPELNTAVASAVVQPVTVEPDPIVTASFEDPIPAPPPPPVEVYVAPQFDPLPAGSGWGRRVVYSVSQQRVWLVEEDDTIVDSWLVSGRRGTPRPGTYRVFSKSRHARAVGGRVRMEYMTRFARGRRLAIGFHSIPVNIRSGAPIQSEGELGQYRSAGCVRQRMGDAIKLWDFAPTGTKVVVTR